MEVVYCTVILIIPIFLVVKHLQQRKKQLPPTPPALPILGHFHLLKGPKHRTLKSLWDSYGPIIYLRFGNRPTVVVSPATIAEECFTKNDIVLADRPQSLVSKVFSYNDTSLSFSPYGDHWCNLRGVITIHIFCPTSLQQSAALRTEEIRFNVQKMLSSFNAETWKELNLTSLFQDLVHNVRMKMICGKRWCTSADLFNRIVSLATISDYIPFLRWVCSGGIKKMFNLRKQTDKFVQVLIDEGRKDRISSYSIDWRRKTLVQAYLSLQEAEPEYYTDYIIK